MKRARELFALIAGIGLLGCSHMQLDSKSGGISKNELVQIARQYLNDKRPGWFDEVLMLPPAVTEHQDYWEVSFDLPSNMKGGTPVVDIDKKSRVVIDAYYGK
jgi:hypothetical protein